MLIFGGVSTLSTHEGGQWKFDTPDLLPLSPEHRNKKQQIHPWKLTAGGPQNDGFGKGNSL